MFLKHFSYLEENIRELKTHQACIYSEDRPERSRVDAKSILRPILELVMISFGSVFPFQPSHKHILHWLSGALANPFATFKCLRLKEFHESLEISFGGRHSIPLTSKLYHSKSSGLPQKSVSSPLDQCFNFDGIRGTPASIARREK
jgi:hypothetical protein